MIDFSQFLTLINTDIFSPYAIIILLGALIYLIGKIKLNNNILHIEEKEVYYFAGITKVNNIIFLPLTVLVFIWALFHFDLKYPIFLLCLFFYQGILGFYAQKYLLKSRKETLNYKNDEKNKKNKTSIKQMSEVLMGLMLIILNLYLLTQVLPFLIFAIILWVDFISVIFIVSITSSLETVRPVKIKLQNGKVLDNVRVIEYLGHLDLLKIEEKGKVKFIPKKEIVEIELL